MAHTVPLQLQRCEIQIESSRGVDGVVDAVRVLFGHTHGDTGALTVVAVNVAASATAQPRLFCRANIEAVLASQPSSLAIDVASADQYRQFALATLEATRAHAALCRALLRTTLVAGCGAPLAELRQRLDLVTLMVDGLALQRRDDALRFAGERVSAAIRECAGSATAADTVRCMDDLHYTLLPALAAVTDGVRG